MSRENVEIMRRAVELMTTDPDAFLAMLDPAIEWDQTLVRPDAEVVHGVDAVRRAARTWQGAFEDYRRELEEIIDAGDEVVTVVHLSGTGKGSGARVGQQMSQVWTIRDGRIVRCRSFPEREDALKAAGVLA